MIKICKSASVSYQYDDKSIFLQYHKLNVGVPKLHTDIAEMDSQFSKKAMKESPLRKKKRDTSSCDDFL